MRFLSNFGCKIISMCSINFWHQQDSNSLFKGSIGHVTSYRKWPIARGGRLPEVPATRLWLGKCWWLGWVVAYIMGGGRLREVVAYGGSIVMPNQTCKQKTAGLVASLHMRHPVIIRFILFHWQNYLFWYTTVQTLVQSSWSEKSRVYQIWTTRGSQYIHSIKSLNSIQLGQKLIDHSVCYPCAVMPTARCKWIKLIEEQNTRLGTLGSVFNLK